MSELTSEQDSIAQRHHVSRELFAVFAGLWLESESKGVNAIIRAVL